MMATPSPPTPALPVLLPLPLFEHIVAFAVEKPDLRARAYTCEKISQTDGLDTLALVSRAWQVSVREIAAHFSIEKIELKLKLASRAEVLDLRRKVQLRGRGVRELRVTMGEFNEYRRFVENDMLVEQRELGWDAVFAHLPGLKRLDLDWMPLASRHVKEMLASAAKHCLAVEELVLPRKPDPRDEIDGVQIDLLMTTLYMALERWFTKGKCGGIKLLSVPGCHEKARERYSTAYLNHVTRFCPNLQRLEEPKYRALDEDAIWCRDQLTVTLETWEAFNARCTDLREFNWVCAPFADPFFRVFGEHVKPELKKLSLTANMSWDWVAYFKQCSDRSNSSTVPSSSSRMTSKPGYGGLAVNFGAALKGCPALRELVISVDQMGNLEDENVHLRADAFGPVFWGDVARHCPLVETISVNDLEMDSDDPEVIPLQGLSDASLFEMADLKNLAKLKLDDAAVTGNGIFEFLRRLPAPTPSGKVVPGDLIGTRLECCINIAGAEELSAGLPQYYVEILALLKRLVETNEKDLGVASLRHKLRLEIKDARQVLLNKTRGQVYLDEELIPLIACVKEANPSLQVQVMVSRDASGAFRVIDRFLLCWGCDLDSGEIIVEDDVCLPTEESEDEDEYGMDLDGEQDFDNDEEYHADI